MTAAAAAAYAAARDARTAAFAAAARALPAIMIELEAQSAAADAEVAKAKARQAETVEALMSGATEVSSDEMAVLRGLVAEYVASEHGWTTADWPHNKSGAVWGGRTPPFACDGQDDYELPSCQSCEYGRDAAAEAKAQAVLAVRAALVGDYSAALTHAREAESIELGVRGEVLTWGGLPECCEVLLEVVEEQRVATTALALKSADKDVTLALECIGMYARKALESVFDLSHSVDEQSAEAAFKSAAWNVEELREYVATMGRDMERLREAWRARHRAEVSE